MEMRLKTGFMKKIVGLSLQKILYKQKKIKMKFDIREFEVTTDENGKLQLNVNASATMEKEDFEKLMKGIINEDED